MTSIGLIPRNRLRLLPKEVRLSHEYCFFLHDECAHALVEYERAGAHRVKVHFDGQLTADQFNEIAGDDPIRALRDTGFSEDARRIILNTITMAMTSDCLHHIYEALRCFEKRKFIVAFNLLRKPLKDSLLYLSWILGDEDGFYAAFTLGNPEELSYTKLGPARTEIFEKAIAKTDVSELIDAHFLSELLYDRSSGVGFEMFFQHAIHLITRRYPELKTTPENFNFIFKDPASNDVYRWVYLRLPYVLLFLAHVIVRLFDKMRAMDIAARNGFMARTILGYQLALDFKAREAVGRLQPLSEQYECDSCKAKLKLTQHNAAKIVMAQSFRCTKCGRNNGLPFAWLFGRNDVFA